MRVVIVTLVIAASTLSAAAAEAQTFAPQGPLTASILAGADLVGPITAAPDLAGDELLFRSRLWPAAVFVARLHPTRSGPLGLYPVPGLCLESAQAFLFVPERVTIADLNGDGLDDLVGTAGTQVQVLIGSGLQACR